MDTNFPILSKISSLTIAHFCYGNSLKTGRYILYSWNVIKGTIVSQRDFEFLINLSILLISNKIDTHKKST